MTLGQAIHEYRENHGLSMEKFSSISGLSKAYISILERNKTPHGNIPAPSIDTYVRVAKTMSMDVNDLLALVDDRISLVNKTDPNLLSYQGTDKIVPFSEPAGDIVRFPVVASVCAGYNGLAVEEYSEETEEIPCSMFKGYPADEIRVLRASGESMYPRFMDGDRVLVHVQDDVDDGDVAVVIYNGDESTLKRLYHIPGGVELVPYNPEYQTKRITGPEASRVRLSPPPPTPHLLICKGCGIFSYSPSRSVDSALRCRLPYI